MPPKKRLRAAAASTTSAKTTTPKQPSFRRTKHATQKAPSVDPSIRAAFQQYASPPSDAEDSPSIDDMLIAVPDVNRALRALKYPLPPSDFFEEDSEGISWVEFNDLAVAMRDSRDSESADDGDNSNFEEGDDEEMAQDDEERKEIDTAFGLFFPASRSAQGGGLRGEGRITIADLRRIAIDLKEEVDDSVLRLMIEEANGDGSADSLRRGVGRAEFESVMRRAGIF